MIESTSYKNTIVFGEKGYRELNNFFLKNNFSKVLVLCDENTQQHCIPFFFQQIDTTIDAEIIETESGEQNKDISTCQQLWNTFSDLNADRNSVVINLGGGILTDMGGFVASTYLRGIPFINIPTSLLAMVDASVGGKTGVNRDGLKNQIGLFKTAAFTLIDIRYLGTLPQRELKSGLAEMLKHGLITDKNYWNKLSDLSQLNLTHLEELVKHSVRIKSVITEEDREESGLRKILNYGHTLGHAIETYFLKNPNTQTLLHGEAVAIGMVLEGYLSVLEGGLCQEDYLEIKTVILKTFTKIDFTRKDMEEIIALLKYDKKNRAGRVNFVLLHEIGKAKTDYQVDKESIYRAFESYME